MKGKESLKEQVDLIRATAESIVISNEKDLKMATDFTKEVKEKQKIIKDFYEPMVKATKESYDKIKAERDNLLKPLQDTEKEMRSLMNEYNNKLLLLKRAEEERIRKEKENQEKKLEEIQKDIAKGNTDNVQQRVTEIMNTTTLNNIPLVELSKVGKDYLLQQYKIMKALNQEFKIPGIEIKEEVTTVIR